MQRVPAAKVKVAAACLAAAFVLLAIIGGVKGYSPVPYWDMWDGYLSFYTRASQGDWQAWWAPHNEHRIVLARVLFWVDLALLEGKGWFLILVNYLLAAASLLLLWAILKEKLGSESPNTRFVFGAFLCAWLFSWIQYQNFTWGFQSQFFLAQLIPLTAFYCIHKCSMHTSLNHARAAWGWFVLAVVLGIAALGTMANGVLTLPLIAALAIALRFSWHKVLALIVLSALGTALYFYGFPTGATDQSMTRSLLEYPFQIIAYALLYLGAPFYYFLGKGTVALVIAQALGLFVVCSSAHFLWQALQNVRANSLNLALLTFLLYIGGTAVATATGRLGLGLNTQSRYMTPALMAWAALLVLYAPYLARLVRTCKWRRVAIPFGILLILMLARQVKALESHESELFNRHVAALALSLQVNDKKQILFVYPVSEHALQIAKQPAATGVSVFGDPVIQNARHLLETHQATTFDNQCVGSLFKTDQVEDDTRYVKVTGRLNTNTQPLQPVLLTDANNLIVGYALSGTPEPNLENSGQRIAFKGYLLKDYANAKLNLVDPNQNCQASVTTSQAPATETPN